MKKIIDRLKREPIFTRAGLAAILNVLVVAGVVDTGLAHETEVVIVGAVDVLALFLARAKTTADVDLVQSAAYRRAVSAYVGEPDHPRDKPKADGGLTFG